DSASVCRDYLPSVHKASAASRRRPTAWETQISRPKSQPFSVRGLARVDIECFPSSFMEDGALNPNVVPVFDSGSGTALDFNPDHVFDSNPNPTHGFDSDPILNFGCAGIPAARAASAARARYPAGRGSLNAICRLRYDDLSPIRDQARPHPLNGSLSMGLLQMPLQLLHAVDPNEIMRDKAPSGAGHGAAIKLGSAAGPLACCFPFR
ncbi:hypothetical protein EVAR_98563_1, partial [Eumeta japonica]